jgi:serine phosphatase RsbU (regulator of sigma subunit)
LDDKTKTALKRFLISFVVYTMIFTFFDNYVYFNDELKYKIYPSIILISFFPLIWGPWGIAGLSLGSLASSFLSSYFQETLSIPEIIVFSTIVLIMNIFIYKLYYSFEFNNKTASLHFHGAENLVKLIVVICLANMFYVFTHVYFEAVFSGTILRESILNDFINDYFFITNISLIFNILLISILGFIHIKLYKPKKTDSRMILKYLKISSQNQILKYFKAHSEYLTAFPKIINLMLIVYAISLVIQSLNFLLTDQHNSTLIFFNIVFIVFLVILKPIKADFAIKENRSFNEFVIFVLLAVSISSILFAKFLSIYTINLHEIFYIIKLRLSQTSTFAQIIFVFGTSIFLMFYLQKKFSEPLNRVSEITEEYVLDKLNNEDGELKEHDKNLKNILNELEVLSHKEYDIGPLAHSIKDMINNLEVYIHDLNEATSEKKRINTELSIASKIQNNMLPNTFPPFPDKLDEFDIYAFYIPAKNIGGDFYDYFLIDDDHLAIVIGDVSGKGISAALFMSMVKTLIKEHVYSDSNIVETFSNINEKIIENNDTKTNMFATVWFGILEISSGKLTFINAGHEHPFISHDHSGYSILTAKSSIILGITNNAKYIQNETTMEEGDRLCLYTDGITEGINENDEQFSKDRLINVLNMNNQIEIRELILKVKKELNDFTQCREQFDDETMLIFEYRKNRNYR